MGEKKNCTICGYHQAWFEYREILGIRDNSERISWKRIAQMIKKKTIENTQTIRVAELMGPEDRSNSWLRLSHSEPWVAVCNVCCVEQEDLKL